MLLTAVACLVALGVDALETSVAVLLLPPVRAWPPDRGGGGGGVSPDPIPQVDRVVHEPARMALLSVLDGVADADSLFLE